MGQAQVTPPKSLILGLECDHCGRYSRQRVNDAPELACPHCQTSLGNIPADWSLGQGCPVCGCRHLYRRKDFNQLVGLVIIVIGAVLGVLVSYWFLLAVSLIDLLIYRWVNDLAVCYRCIAEIKIDAGVAELELFEHHTAEIYEYKDENLNH